MISKNLLKSSLIYTIIGALPLASAFFLLLFYTNYLTRADYGALVLYISFTLFVQILVNFGLDTYIGISYFEHKHDLTKLRSTIGNLVAYLLVVGVICSLVFLIIGKPLFGLIFKGNELDFFPYGMMSVVTAFFNSFFKTYTNLLINQQRPARFAIVNLANFFMTLAFSLGGLFLYPYTLIGPMWGRLLSGAGIFIIAYYSFNRETSISLRFGEMLKKTVAFSLPVLIFFLLSWIISNISSWIIERYLSLDEVAIFGLALQFTLLIEFTLSGLTNAFMPKVYELMKSGNNLTQSTPDLNKYFSTFNAVTLLIIPAATFLVPLIMPWLIPHSYTQTYLFLGLLNISFVSRGLYNYFLAPVYFHKKTKVLPKIYTFTAVIQIASSVVLIKYFGIWGAVWANLLTKIVQNIFLYAESRKFFAYSFNTNKMIALPAISILVIILSEMIPLGINLNIIHLFQFLIIALLVWLAYRNEIGPLFKWGLNQVGFTSKSE